MKIDSEELKRLWEEVEKKVKHSTELNHIHYGYTYNQTYTSAFYINETSVDQSTEWTIFEPRNIPFKNILLINYFFWVILVQMG